MINYASIEERKYALPNQPGYYVEWWWDRYSRQWIIQLKDKDGYQVGAAAYAPNHYTINIEIEYVVNNAPDMILEALA